MFARGASWLLGVGAIGVLAVALILQAGAGPPEASAQGAAATATATPSPLPECSNGTAVANPASNAGLVADCSALLRAKDALRGTATLNWSATRAIASWDGVGLTTSDPRRVSSISLVAKSLTGSLPANLGSLSELTSLNLDLNRLTGEIPPELGNLSKLEYLNLNGNWPTGYTYGNRLTGEIPASFADLASLRKLHLGGGRLTGTIPDLSGTTGLQVLNLRGHQLTGGIPAWLGALTRLERLLLARNLLTGEIPLSLINLTPAEPASLTLFDLKLRGNSLTGCIPPPLRRVSSNDLAQMGLPYCPPPAKPTGFNAVPGNGNAVLSWTDPGDTGITGYRYRIGPGAAWRELTCDGVVVGGILARGLTNGRAYRLELQARNVHGWGLSATIPVTPIAAVAATPAPTTMPPAPSGADADGGDRRIKLSWTTPAVVTEGHRVRYRYRLRVSGGEWGPWKGGVCVLAAMGGMTLTGLDVGVTYDVRLQPHNAAGWGTYADVTATTVPAEPAGLEATLEDGGAVLSWNDPGTGITGYRYRTGPAARWRTLAHDADAIAAIRVRGLTNGTLYTLELEARNAGGWGPTATATVTPAATPSGGAATTP